MVKKATRKTARKTAKKTSRKTTRKTTTRAKKTSNRSRSHRCILVCGKDKCVEACISTSGAVTGECIPCPICGHGHFCENDYTCLSCGATRELVVRPYKGE